MQNHPEKKILETQFIAEQLMVRLSKMNLVSVGQTEHVSLN